MSILTTATQQTKSWFDYFKNKSTQIYEHCKSSKEAQKNILALTRTAVGIVSIRINPGAAIIGGVTTTIRPELMQGATKMIDGAVTGMWNQLKFEHKLALAGVGVVIVSTEFAIPVAYYTFSLLGTVFAFKVGSELTHRNLAKEQISMITIKAEEELSANL